MLSVGQRIRERRIAKGFTVEQLAEILGISRQTLYRYENDTIPNIPSGNIEKLAKTLEVTPSYLMGWESNTAMYMVAIDRVVSGYIMVEASNADCAYDAAKEIYESDVGKFVATDEDFRITYISYQGQSYE